MTQYAICTDLNLCVGCLACCTACKMQNNVPIGSFWNKVLRVGPNLKQGAQHFPDVEMYFMPIGCQHCAKPECVKVCPTGASQKVADGTVQIDKEKCIGCQFCVMACPYGVRYLNEQEKVVEKCTLCEQKIIAGELPQCVAQCSARARYFGDLDKGLASFQGGGTHHHAPSPAYEDVDKTRVSLSEWVEPFTEAQVYHLPDVGNKPSFRYILRDVKWQG